MKGTKRERSPGVWELRAYAGRDPITGSPRQISRTFRGKERAADTALAKLVSEVAEGKHGGTKATVAQLLDAWLEDCTRHVSPATVAVYRHSVNAHLRGGIGRLRLDRLGARNLDDLYRAMGEAGSSPYIIRQAHSAVRAALTVGMRWGWVKSNVALLARPPKLPSKEVTAPTPAEVRDLIVAIEPDDPDLAHMVLLAALTGVRRSELCALRWADWDGDRLSVSRRLVEASGRVSEHAGTKTGKGKRIVLDELGAVVLTRVRQLQEARAKEAKSHLPANGYLLSLDGLGGAPRRPSSVSRAVGEAARAAGMPHVHLHGLRHYAATELLASGVDPRTAANRLGHADPALTLRVYAHRIEQRDREAAAVLGATLKGALPKAKRRAKPPS